MGLDLYRYRLILLCLITAMLSGCAWLKKSETDAKEREDQATYHYNLAYGHYFDSTNNSSETPGEFTVVVGGVFEAGFGEFDSKVLYARLDVAQKMYSMGSAINALEIRVEDPLATDEVVSQI